MFSLTIDNECCVALRAAIAVAGTAGVDLLVVFQDGGDGEGAIGPDGEPLRGKLLSAGTTPCGACLWEVVEDAANDGSVVTCYYL